MERVTVDIRNHVMGEGESERLSSSYAGTRRTVNGADRVFFSMPAFEDSAEESQVLITVRNGEIELRKKGAAESYMLFIPGERTEGYLSSPHGRHPFRLMTDRLETEKEGEGLRIKIWYGLDFGGVAMKYKLLLTVDPVLRDGV